MLGFLVVITCLDGVEHHLWLFHVLRSRLDDILHDPSDEIVIHWSVLLQCFVEAFYGYNVANTRAYPLAEGRLDQIHIIVEARDLRIMLVESCFEYVPFNRIPRI